MPLFEKTDEQRNYAESEPTVAAPAAPSSGIDDLLGLSTPSGRVYNCFVYFVRISLRQNSISWPKIEMFAKN